MKLGGAASAAACILKELDFAGKCQKLMRNKSIILNEEKDIQVSGRSLSKDALKVFLKDLFILLQIFSFSYSRNFYIFFNKNKKN